MAAAPSNAALSRSWAAETQREVPEKADSAPKGFDTLRFFGRSCSRNKPFTSDAYGYGMARYAVVRLWLADRPGSLGLIASKIGEVGGDLVGIDILERDGARAVDELTVELPAGYDPDELAAVLSQLPGVEVEDLRHLVSRPPYASRDPLDAAVLLAESSCIAELSAAVVQGISVSFSCEWCAVLGKNTTAVSVLAKVGNPPSVGWLDAFVTGAKAGLSLATGHAGLVGPRDVAWAPLDSSELVVVAGRDGPPFRSRERRQLQQLCRIADARWFQLDHPGAELDHVPGAARSAKRQEAS